jgi:hypothetical protein
MREQSNDPDSVVKPNIQIDGENYEVTGTPATIAAVIGHIRMFCFILLFAGEFFFNMLGGIQTMPDPIKDAH